jgi:hypothetical protein
VTVERRVPTSVDLLYAVRQFIQSEVMPAVDGRLRFNARVAANVLAMLERELAQGPGIVDSHRHNLDALGFRDDAELVQAIQEGQTGELTGQIIAMLRAYTTQWVSIVNPRHLWDGDAAGAADTHEPLS